MNKKGGRKMCYGLYLFICNFSPSRKTLFAIAGHEKLRYES